MCQNCNCDICTCDETGLPKGDKGEQGDPLCLAISCIDSLGNPFASSSLAYVPVPNGTFVFGTSIADAFTGIKANIWQTLANGISLRIVDLVSGATVYENTTISSLNPLNIETATGLNIPNLANAILQVQVKINAAANFVNIRGITLYYA